MVQGDPGVDPGRQQVVDQPVVEVESGPVEWAGAVRLHSGPGDREAVGAHTQITQQPDIFGVAVHVIARRPTVGTVRNRPGGVA